MITGVNQDNVVVWGQGLGNSAKTQAVIAKAVTKNKRGLGSVCCTAVKMQGRMSNRLIIMCPRNQREAPFLPLSFDNSLNRKAFRKDWLVQLLGSNLITPSI